MKNVVVFIIIIGVLVALYFGYINMLSKIMHREKPAADPLVEFKEQRDQNEKVQELREQQKLLMQQRQQRLRDMQQR